MISKRIWCSHCGHEGSREIPGTETTESIAGVFTLEGRDPRSGKLYFRCPCCKVVIMADPADAPESYTMNGYPTPTESVRLARSQNLMTMAGGLYMGVLVLIMIAKILS